MPERDFDAFHAVELPARGHAPLAAADVAGIAPIAFQLPDGRSYTYAPAAGDGIAITSGDATAHTVVALAEPRWWDFVDEVHTASGLFYGKQLAFPRGTFQHFERWEPALRALVDGRPIYDPARIALRDRDGKPLDLTRSFTLDDDDAELRHFIETAGFLHVRGVFAAGEVAHLRAIADRLAEQAVPGDRRSWWARDAAGSQLLCRLTYIGMAVPEIAALDADPRMQRLAHLCDATLVPAPDRCDGHSVVIKHAGVSEGLADLPWHRDCGLGGHRVKCPNMQIGIQLERADADSGCLQFLAGSSGCSVHRLDVDRQSDLPIVAITAEPGDCTLHFGDTLHAAPPPRAPGRGRRTLYSSFYAPHMAATIGAGQSYNDVMLARVDGLVTGLKR